MLRRRGEEILPGAVRTTWWSVWCPEPGLNFPQDAETLADHVCRDKERQSEPLSTYICVGSLSAQFEVSWMMFD